MVPVRHASRALGAAPRREEVLRVVLRDLAPLDPESEREQVVARLGAPGPGARAADADAYAVQDAADDATRSVPPRARAGRAGRRSTYVASAFRRTYLVRLKPDTTYR